MNESPAAAPPAPADNAPPQRAPSTFAWISLIILGVLNGIAITFAVPTCALLVLLAFESDAGAIAIIGLPEFAYVPAQFVLVLPSLIIVIVAAARKTFSLPYKLHIGLLILSSLILLVDLVGFAIVIVSVYVR